MAKINLKDLLISDIANAKAAGKGYSNSILAPGKYVAKIMKFVEEPNYNLISVEINGTPHNYFYNYTLYQSEDLNKDVLVWLKSLANITVTDSTSYLDITNSAIGCSYTIDIYNYTPKSGKNAGVAKDGINFKTIPVLEVQTIETVEMDALPAEGLPF